MGSQVCSVLPWRGVRVQTWRRLQGPGCGPEPSALTVEPDCDVVCGRPAGPGATGAWLGEVCARSQALAVTDWAMVPALRGRLWGCHKEERTIWRDS